MIFEDSSDESVDSNSTVVYDNSYNSSSFMTSYYSNENKSRITSCNVSRDNSFKSQHYMENIKEDILKSKLKKLKKKCELAVRLQRKNYKLKYKLVLEELKMQKVKNLLYRMNYNLILEQLRNRELMKYYDFGIIYKAFLKALE